MTHILKSYPEFFADTVIGVKTHEIRQISNNLSLDGTNAPFSAGDRLMLHEFDPVTQKFLGDVCFVRVTMVDPPKPWLDPDYVVMSIRLEDSGF